MSLPRIELVESTPNQNDSVKSRFSSSVIHS